MDIIKRAYTDLLSNEQVFGYNPHDVASMVGKRCRFTTLNPKKCEQIRGRFNVQNVQPKAHAFNTLGDPIQSSTPNKDGVPQQILSSKTPSPSTTPGNVDQEIMLPDADLLKGTGTIEDLTPDGGGFKKILQPSQIKASVRERTSETDSYGYAQQ